MKNKIILLLIPSLFLIAYFAGQFLVTQNENNIEYPVKLMSYEPCDPTQSQCVAFIKEQALRFYFDQSPSALRPFTVSLVSNQSLQEVDVDFSMLGMDMGVNRFGMHKHSDKGWQGEMILPICSLGRNDWVAELRVLYQGELWIAKFGFEQSAN